jgi:DNA (cytosine-5)-methyltransferase 1
MEKTICELFAGVGGFRLGFEKTSPEWKTVWFSQWEPGRTKQWAHNCYVNHWSDINEYTGMDIAQVDKESIPNHSLLVGGFPCQDYSVARPLSGNNGIEGKKGVLWWQIRDTLIAKKPPFVLLENVDRLLKSPANQRGRDFGVMLACLDSLGYYVEWRVVNAADYGVAQKRRRTFIFAASKSTKYYKEHCELAFEEIIGESGFFATSFPITGHTKIRTIEMDTSDIANVSDSFAFEFENAGAMVNGLVSTTKITPEFETPTPLRSLLEKNVPEKYYLGENLKKWQYMKGAKKIERTSKSGYTYIFSEGAIPFPDNLDGPARTILTSESGSNRSTHVIEDPETKRYRLLTPLEAERIQGFNDNWTNTGMPEKFRYFCMGNALVVPLVHRMAQQFNTIFDGENN